MGFEFSVWPTDLVERFVSKARAAANGTTSISAQQSHELEALAAATGFAGTPTSDISAFVRHVLSEAGLEIRDEVAGAIDPHALPVTEGRHASATALGSMTPASRGGTLVHVNLRTRDCRTGGTRGARDEDSAIVKVTSQLALRADGTLWDHDFTRPIRVPGTVTDVASEIGVSVILTDKGLFVYGTGSEAKCLETAPPPETISTITIGTAWRSGPSRRHTTSVGVATNDGRLLIWQNRSFTWSGRASLGLGHPPDLETTGPIVDRISNLGHSRSAVLTRDGKVMVAVDKRKGRSRFHGTLSDHYQELRDPLPRMTEIADEGLMLDDLNHVWVLNSAKRCGELLTIDNVVMIRDDLAVTSTNDVFRIRRYQSSPIAVARAVPGLVDLVGRGQGHLLVVTSEPEALKASLTAR